MLDRTKEENATVQNTKIQFFLLAVVWVFNSFKPEWTIPGLRAIAILQPAILLILFLYWIASLKNIPGNPLTKYILSFLILIIVSSYFSRNNGLGRETIQGTFFLCITYLATITFANSTDRIFKIFNIFILGNLLIAILGIKGGGIIPSVAIYADENDLALIMNVLFPITLFLGVGENDKLKRIFYFFSTGLFVTVIVLTNSRGGFVGFVAVAMFAWFMLPVSKIKSTFVIMAIIITMALFAPKSFWDEMKTIEQGSEESTAGSRIYLWKIAVREFVDNPIIGVGINNFGIWLPDYVRPDDTYSDGKPVRGTTTAYGRVNHSIYFTLLSELGSIGVILYFLMIRRFYKEVSYTYPILESDISNKEESSRKILLAENMEKCRKLSLGVAGGMIGFLVSGIFLSVLYYPQFWLLCSLAVILGNCKKSLAAESAIVAGS